MAIDFRKIAIGAVALCAATCLTAFGDVVRVDFGTETSPLREGFLRVTDKTEFKDGVAVGWASVAGLSSKDVPIPREWRTNESRGTGEPPPIYTTDLREAYVEGTAPATLRVRAPDGRYRVWMLCGSAGGDSNLVWNVELTAGETVRSAAFLARYECRVIEFPAVSKDGTLDIRFSTQSRWLVNAMLVAPEADYPALKKGEIAAIEQEIYLLPADVLKDWKHTPYVEKAPRPEFTAAEQERGFAIYTRSWVTPIWPNTNPRREEMDPTLQAFAAREQYEPLNFVILPFRDFDSAGVEVSDLAAADGSKILRQDMDVRYVRYMWTRPNYNTHGTYYRVPDVLMPMSEPRPLVKDENFRVWITVHVGPIAPAGLYKGKAIVRVDRKSAEVPIVFRVLPITLQKDQSIVYGVYYEHPYDNLARTSDPFSQRWWRRKAELEAADLSAHGQNNIISNISGRQDAKGNWTIAFDAFERKLNLFRASGWNTPIVVEMPVAAVYRRHMGTGNMGTHLRLLKMPPPAFFDDITAMVRAIEVGRNLRQWPELLYYPIDEPAVSETSVKFMTEILKAVKQVPGVRTYVTADPNSRAFASIKPYVDIWCCQPFSLPRETVLADMKERPGVEYWCYPNHIAGENDHTPTAGARMTYGFGFWRSGFRALVPWIYQYINGDQWNYLDDAETDFMNRTGDDGGPIPVVLWEAYRGGIDDGRYLTTLERWIETARAAGLVKPADEAEADLKFVWNSITVQPKYQYNLAWDADSFDVYRWILARQILKLQDAVNGSQPR